MNYRRLVPTSAEEQSSLAVRISAIVFWGMVWIGLLGAFALLRGLEGNIKLRYQATADYVAHEVDNLLDRGPAAFKRGFSGALAHELIVLDVRGINVQLDEGTFVVGDTAEPGTRLERQAEYRRDGALHSTAIAVYLPSIEATLDARRKQMLVLLGGVLIAFGLALQWWLRRRADMHWVSRLNKAISADRFRLYCQPIVPLARARGEAACHEVLVRLLDEEGRLVPPNAFIAAAERYNLMPQIDRWVIRTLCAALVAQPRNHERFAINLSGQSLGDTGFLDFAAREIETSGLDPVRLCFEITETAAISNLERATTLIQALRGRGCEFALDDFGSGLSSFAYLKNLPVGYLKIDGAFVKHSVENPIDSAMVAAIHTVGEAMGIRTIAEFVENGAILAVLEDIGVHFAQGYGIARPAPIAELFAADAPAARGARA